MDQEIRHLIGTLNRQYEKAFTQGSPARIEIDNMLATMRQLYDRLHVLQTAMPPSAVDDVREQVSSFTVVADDVQEPVITLEETDVFGIRHVEPVTVNEEPKIQDEVPPVAAGAVEPEPRPVEVKQQPPIYIADAPVKAPASRSRKSAAESFDQVTTVAQTFTGKTTLHDRMSSGKGDKSVADHLQSAPLSDLKKSIGVNEKYVFVNELFNGNHQLFNRSLEELNSFTSLEQAQHHLHEKLCLEMQWDKECSSFAKLNDLLKRRFNVL